MRQDSITGPVVATANLMSTGGTGHLGDDDGAAGERGAAGARAVPDVPHGHGRATGGNLFNLNWAEFGGNGVTVQSTSTTVTRAARWRPRWR